jgi:acetolactate synthase regulatory subunit
MTWTLHLTAKDQRRLYSRLFLVLEQQMVAIQAFHAEAKGSRVQITIVVCSEEDRTYRIEQLLCRLQDVTSVCIGKG